MQQTLLKFLNETLYYRERRWRTSREQPNTHHINLKSSDKLSQKLINSTDLFIFTAVVYFDSSLSNWLIDILVVAVSSNRLLEEIFNNKLKFKSQKNNSRITFLQYLQQTLLMVDWLFSCIFHVLMVGSPVVSRYIEMPPTPHTHTLIYIIYIHYHYYLPVFCKCPITKLSLIWGRDVLRILPTTCIY